MSQPIGVTIEVTAGPHAGEEIRVEAGSLCRIGSDASFSQYALDQDFALSMAHFIIECGLSGASIRDLRAHSGTYVNGVRIHAQALRTGDVIMAGSSIFLARVDGDEGPPPDTGDGDGSGARAHDAARGDVLLELLLQSPEPLFAVVDGARDPRVVELLGEFAADAQSLFEGEKALLMAAVAPYLVHLPKEGPVLPKLIEEGWGRAWGIFLTSAASFADTRAALRRLLIAVDESGQQVYFRFYDPRVLRLFLPTCNDEQFHMLFSAAGRYLMEDEDPDTLLSYWLEARGGLHVGRVSLVRNPEETRNNVPHPA